MPATLSPDRPARKRSGRRGRRSAPGPGGPVVGGAAGFVRSEDEESTEITTKVRVFVASQPEQVYDGGMEAQVAAAVDRLLTVDPAALDDASLQDAVVALQRLDARFAAARSRVVSVWDARGVWAQDRSRSGAARLARDARCAPVRAGAEVRRARKLRTMPLTREAFGAGRLSIDAVDLLCAANHAPLEALFARDEAMLVARGEELHFDDFRRVIGHWRNAADDDAADDRALKKERERYAKAAETFDGTTDIQARLPPIGGAIFRTEMARLEQELFEADWVEARDRLGDAATAADLARPPEQRRADALVEMARRSAAKAPGSKEARILISILAGYETFAGRVCELADGTVLTPGQVAGLLSEADIERIVFDTPSRVVDVSERRCFTGALRRAIEIRDRHCTHPGCRVPADRCHVDHISEYAAGGPTTQVNGRLLCPAHNRQRPGRASPPDRGP